MPGRRELWQLASAQVTVASPCTWHETKAYEPRTSPLSMSVCLLVAFFHPNLRRMERDPSCSASCSWASQNHLGARALHVANLRVHAGTGINFFFFFYMGKLRSTRAWTWKSFLYFREKKEGKKKEGKKKKELAFPLFSFYLYFQDFPRLHRNVVKKDWFAMIND